MRVKEREKRKEEETERERERGRKRKGKRTREREREMVKERKMRDRMRESKEGRRFLQALMPCSEWGQPQTTVEVYVQMRLCGQPEVQVDGQARVGVLLASESRSSSKWEQIQCEEWMKGLHSCVLGAEGVREDTQELKKRQCNRTERQEWREEAGRGFFWAWVSVVGEGEDGLERERERGSEKEGKVEREEASGKWDEGHSEKVQKRKTREARVPSLFLERGCLVCEKHSLALRT